MTAGYLMEFLLYNPKALSELYSHILIDECHEQSISLELLCLMLKLHMARADKGAHTPALVLMS